MQGFPWPPGPSLERFRGLGAAGEEKRVRCVAAAMGLFSKTRSPSSALLSPEDPEKENLGFWVNQQVAMPDFGKPTGCDTANPSEKDGGGSIFGVGTPLLLDLGN